MSVFAPGTGGTLKATTKPSALVEVAHALQMAELTALAANPSNTSQNVTATISFDVGLISLFAAIPFLALLNTSGTISLIPLIIWVPLTAILRVAVVIYIPPTSWRPLWR